MTGDAGGRWLPPGAHSPGGAGQRAPAGAGPVGAAPLLDQAFDGDSLYALRAAVAAHASEAGLPQDRADDLVVAAHELAANAVLHGAGHGRLRLWEHDHVLQCEVSDDGAPPAGDGAPADGHASRDPARWRRERGHGLWLIREVADETSLRSGPDGTVATVIFALPR